MGSITYHGFNPELAIISDDAGQFKVFLHGLCWVHAERTIQKIVGFNDHQNQLLEKTKTDIWQFYRDLNKYRGNPDKTQKQDLKDRFNRIFTHKTGFATLDMALKRIYRNKSELLLVLNRPDVPLHNNLSERDIRKYVKRRKISGSTRSDIGKALKQLETEQKKAALKRGQPVPEWVFANKRGEIFIRVPFENALNV